MKNSSSFSHDPLSALLSSIKVNATAGHQTLFIPASKFNYAVINWLEKAGYIFKVKQIKDLRGKITFKIHLKGHISLNLFKNLKRISRPGKRVYLSYRELLFHKNKMGQFNTYLISTSAGLKDLNYCIQNHLGGEILFRI
uniref:Ribosomal protein S8 n=1 Tax=Ancoracysta twista TaxID=2044563 RepID=A0A2H4R8E5_9EUKA|nr:ribosomal protein S8 [Ancoracysta twista]ATY40931.1 ribosomal protein S8 [Ancoracysta twista]